MNNEINAKHFTWDPSMCYHDGKWYCVVLVAPRTTQWGTEPFWAMCHQALVFCLIGGEWVPRGYLEAGPGRRMCAGSLVSKDGMLLAYMSYNENSYGNFMINQEIAILDITSPTMPVLIDKIRPRGGIYRTTKKRNGKNYYACRDPYYTEYLGGSLVVCSGGSRWGVEPSIILHHLASDGLSETGSEVMIQDPHWNGIKLSYELERVSLMRNRDKYFMTAHCWDGWVTAEMKEACRGMGENITSSTIWLFEGKALDNMQLREDIPFIPGSSELGLYGTHFRLTSCGWVGMGWDMESISCDRRQFVRLDSENWSVRKDKEAFDGSAHSCR